MQRGCPHSHVLSSSSGYVPCYHVRFWQQKRTTSPPPLCKHRRKDGHHPIPLQAGNFLQHAKISRWRRHHSPCCNQPFFGSWVHSVCWGGPEWASLLGSHPHKASKPVADDWDAVPRRLVGPSWVLRLKCRWAELLSLWCCSPFLLHQTLAAVCKLWPKQKLWAAWFVFLHFSIKSRIWDVRLWSWSARIKFQRAAPAALESQLSRPAEDLPLKPSRMAGSFPSCHGWCWVQDCFRRQARLSPAAKFKGQLTFWAAFYCREGRGFMWTGFVKAVVQIFVLCSLAAQGWVQTTSPFKVPVTCYIRL